MVKWIKLNEQRNMVINICQSRTMIINLFELKRKRALNIAIVVFVSVRSPNCARTNALKVYTFFLELSFKLIIKSVKELLLFVHSALHSAEWQKRKNMKAKCKRLDQIMPCIALDLYDRYANPCRDQIIIKIFSFICGLRLHLRLLDMYIYE